MQPARSHQGLTGAYALGGGGRCGCAARGGAIGALTRAAAGGANAACEAACGAAGGGGGGGCAAAAAAMLSCFRRGLASPSSFFTCQAHGSAHSPQGAPLQEQFTERAGARAASWGAAHGRGGAPGQPWRPWVSGGRPSPAHPRLRLPGELARQTPWRPSALLSPACRGYRWDVSQYVGSAAPEFGCCNAAAGMPLVITAAHLARGRDSGALGWRWLRGGRRARQHATRAVVPGAFHLLYDSSSLALALLLACYTGMPSMLSAWLRMQQDCCHDSRLTPRHPPAG